MNIYRVMLLLTIFCFISIPSYALATKKDDILKAIQKDEHLRAHFTYESSIANFAQKEQCLQIPHSLHKGERQKDRTAFKWVIDVPVEQSESDRVITQIAQLNSFVIAGLLSKERVTLKSKSEFIRYRLTVKGWKAQPNKRNEHCFSIGKAKHLKVNHINKLEIPVGDGKKDTVYKVAVSVGLPDPLSLPEWANNPEIKKSFPIINKLISGYEREILMVKESNRWREYLLPSQLKRMAKSGAGRSENYYRTDKPKTSRELMLKAFSFDKFTQPPCISLPGDRSKGLRVDKNLRSHKAPFYSVAISDNSVREKWDTRESKTKPYLERLVDLGLLTSYSQDKIYVGKEGRGKHFSGTIYQLSPSYSHIIDERRHCFYLGKGEINVVKLEILASHTPRAKYKFIIKFPNPPEWAKDKALQAGWTDLKSALEYGYACNGESEIDLTEKGTIGGSCWWAYNIFSEL